MDWARRIGVAGIGMVGAVLVSMAAGCGGQSSDDDNPVLFPGVPTFAMVAEDFSAIDLFGPIPAPNFSQLSYIQEIETPSNRVPVEQFIELTMAQGHRAGMTRLRSEFTFADTNDHAIEHTLQVGDLLDLFTLSYTPGDGSQASTITRSYIVAIEQVLGQLFPAAVGNRLQFEVTRHYQSERNGERGRVQTLNFAYDMEIVRTSAPGNYPNLKLSEPAIVIQIREVDPDGVERRREVHFSAEVGMPVFDAVRRDRIVTRRQLVDWRATPAP